MVQPKFSNVSKPKTLDVPPVSQNEKTWKKSRLLSPDYLLLLTLMLMLFLHLDLLMLSDAPVLALTAELLDIAGLNSSGNPAFWLWVVHFQMEAFLVVLYSCDVFAKTYGMGIGFAEKLFKYVQLSIPQVALVGVVLLQPHGFDLNLHLQITLFLNTCIYLMVLIEGYIRRRKWEKKNVTKTGDSDEIPTISGTVIP